MEQKQWIARALEGDRTARAHLFEETISPIYYLCWKLTGSTAQAGDLTRRTFTRAFSHLDQLRPDASFSRWVTAIAVNLCRQSLKQSQPWLFATDDREMAILRDTYVAEEECLSPEVLTNPEARSLALRTITLLPPEQRVCMVLRYVAQLKPHQIAKTMDVDEITVLGRLNSGRRALLTTLPSPTPKAILPELFEQEALGVSVPEMLRGSCMQAVLQTPLRAPEPEPAPEADEPEEETEKKAGLLANMDKKQKALLFGGGGLALVLIVLILILALRGCGAAETPAPELPEPEPAPVEEIDVNLESEAKLKEYGVEVLLTCSRREAEQLVDDWQEILPDYVSGDDPAALELSLITGNDAVDEVRLSLAMADLEITQLRGLALGVNPELDAAAQAITGKYGHACYDGTPLFDPATRTHDSLGVYTEFYRYELIDGDSDGRADTLSITRIGPGFDAKQGVFRPYGDSLLSLIGQDRETASAVLGEGDYSDDNADLYAMSASGEASDGSDITVTAVMEARTEMDAARQSVTALCLDVDGCFAELLPELQLPDSALTLTQLERKLESLGGHMGMVEGDIFAPVAMDTDDDYLAYYDDSLRYLFAADGKESEIDYVEVLDLSDCRLWDAKATAFRQEGFDLEKLLGLDKYQAYSDYGIRSYPTSDWSASALGLWESNGTIRTIHNAADPRPLWGLKLGDKREAIEAKVEKASGYICAADDSSVRYVLPSKRELCVTYDGDSAKTLQLEDHSHQSDYQAPEPIRKSNKELFAEFIGTLPDVRASWCGDLTHDGDEELLVCRPGGSGCLLQLYAVNRGEVSTTPLYTLNLSVNDSTDVYLVDHASGPCLLVYALSESVTTYQCSWRLMSINAAGGEVLLDENESKVNLLDVLLEGQEEFDAVRQQAADYAQQGTYLCGTQTGEAKFSDAAAALAE